MKKYVILNGDTYDKVCVISKRFAVALMAFVMVVIVSATTGIMLAVRLTEQREFTEAINERDSLRNEVLELREAVDAFSELERNHNLNSTIGELMQCPFSEIPHKDSVALFAEEIGLWYPDITMAQFRQETGVGSNPKSIYTASNNLVNMKKVSVRPTTQSGVYNGYGTYANWKLCVIDMYLWERFVFGGVKPTREQYFNKLSTFAEAPDYVEKIKGFSNK